MLSFAFHICYLRFLHFLPHNGILGLVFDTISMLPFFPGSEFNSLLESRIWLCMIWWDPVSCSVTFLLALNPLACFTPHGRATQQDWHLEKRKYSVKVSPWSCALLHKGMAVLCQSFLPSLNPVSKGFKYGCIRK